MSYEQPEEYAIYCDDCKSDHTPETRYTEEKSQARACAELNEWLIIDDNGFEMHYCPRCRAKHEPKAKEQGNAV